MRTEDVLAALSAFHFIRPLWLFLLPLIGLLWWRVRGQANRGADLPLEIAPHLAAALTVGGSGRRKIAPIDGVAIVLGLLVLGASGPTWWRISNPLVSDTAPLAVVLKVSKSMENTDVPPSRLERAKHKIADLAGERAGAKTALIAYAGTAHQVVPPTEDPEVLKPFLEGLEPRVMPRDGEAARAALNLANEIISAQDVPGAILFLVDRITDADQSAFSGHVQNDGAPVLFWVFGNDTAGRSRISALPASSIIEVTSDRTDVSAVLRNIDAAYSAALSRDDRQDWKDQSWIFAWPAAIVLLFWFRRGWTMQWSVVVCCLGLSFSVADARADGWRDWFLTPDQQGQLAFNNREFGKASDLFQDPEWKAYALYRSGRYKEAAELFAWQETADAAIGEGLALLKSRSYRPAIAAFEKAVERDPSNAAAQHNLDLARYILSYIETTREQSDTGEESGIGADDTVYDNEAGRGTETEQTPSNGQETVPETAEQWMRTVDTRTGDFLKTRFALEAARAPQ